MFVIKLVVLIDCKVDESDEESTTVLAQEELMEVESPATAPELQSVAGPKVAVKSKKATNTESSLSQLLS